MINPFKSLLQLKQRIKPPRDKDALAAMAQFVGECKGLATRRN